VNYSPFDPLFALAHAEGMDAGNAASPTPMVVGSPSSPFGNDVDPNQPQYLVSDGVCGFAWIHFPKANGPAVKYMKANGIGRRPYGKGWDIPVRAFGQSMQRKEAYANAYAKVLNDAGIDCFAQSRMD
jgi:hypothetical protein